MENYRNSGKIYISNIGKLIQTALSLFDFLKLLFTNIEKHQREKEHFLIKEEINLNERF